ncbi:uncharacterized protein BP5553_02903 [Venustampulla echinocandica]|uniref:Uncharacterized protein n=1 Tax=Venustampulla echinocandica TaxID=2656787 RepID=A0A370TST7_9HELO|nr:uncharacterized protein BP5553_02903 [Venustampulla echinocandica]RDL38563.1 hypothetical protein BP5553_02903 [Venustampulla echinocandica]
MNEKVTSLPSVSFALQRNSTFDSPAHACHKTQLQLQLSRKPITLQSRALYLGRDYKYPIHIRINLSLASTSETMGRQHTSSFLFPYREDDNTIKYAILRQPPPSFSSPPTHDYESDNEPLMPISSSLPIEDLDDDALLHFTATGRPIPLLKPNALQKMGGDAYSVQQFLPKRYTDDSIIPAIITNAIPSNSSTTSPPSTGKSLLKRFKRKNKEGNKDKDKDKGIVKVVFMPRGEYLKYFARGLKGEYVGTEPYRRWTEEELDREFKKYRPCTQGRKGHWPPTY